MTQVLLFYCAHPSPMHPSNPVYTDATPSSSQPTCIPLSLEIQNSLRDVWTAASAEKAFSVEIYKHAQIRWLRCQVQ